MKNLLKQTLGLDINTIPKAGKTITNEEKYSMLNTIDDILSLMSERNAFDWKNTWDTVSPIYYSMESDGDNWVQINYQIDKVGEYPKCDVNKCNITFFKKNKLEEFDSEYSIIKDAFIKYAEYFSGEGFYYKNGYDYANEVIDNTDVKDLFEYLYSSNVEDVESMCLTFLDTISFRFILEDEEFYIALSDILSGERIIENNE